MSLLVRNKPNKLLKELAVLVYRLPALTTNISVTPLVLELE